MIIKPHEGPQTFALRQPPSVKEILYGGMRGGGKTLAGLIWIGNRLYKDENGKWQPVKNHPLYRALVIRRNADDLSDWVERLKQVYPEASVAYRPYEIRFPSGALIRTGHLKDEQAYGKYQGAEFQSILVEELTQIPLEKRYVQLISSCRSTIPELRPQIFLTTNPGGQGHGWVKKRFIDVAMPNKVHADKLGNKRIFIPSSIEDNPTLIKNDPDYVKMLDSLRETDEELWKAWRLGDWNVFAGQAFREWRREKHVIPNATEEHFEYELSQCQRIIGFDWGYRDKAVASWLAFTPENRWGVRRCYLYRQVVKTETDPETWAEELATYCAKDNVEYIVLPHDTFAHKESKTTIASVIQGALFPHRVPVVRADSSGGSKLNRKAVTHQFLADAPDGKPFLQVHESCTDFIESLPTLVYDESNIEQVADGDDHSWDSFSYGLVAFIKSNPSFVFKKDLTPKYERGWVNENGIIKPTEDIMEILKRDIEKGQRSWQA